MRILNYFQILSVMILTTILISCTAKNERSRKAADENVAKSRQDVDLANENLRQAKLDSAAEYRAYREQMELKLQENEKLILELKARAKSDKKDLDAVYAKDLEVIERKNAELKTRIANYKTSYSDKWSSFKESFNNEVDNIGKSISRMAND
jgi:PHD/YefM family antitoxin component YafN of YafNO toxin-antitoxin module